MVVYFAEEFPKLWKFKGLTKRQEDLLFYKEWIENRNIGSILILCKWFGITFCCSKNEINNMMCIITITYMNYIKPEWKVLYIPSFSQSFSLHLFLFLYPSSFLSSLLLSSCFLISDITWDSQLRKLIFY